MLPAFFISAPYADQSRRVDGDRRSSEPVTFREAAPATIYSVCDHAVGGPHDRCYGRIHRRILRPGIGLSCGQGKTAPADPQCDPAFLPLAARHAEVDLSRDPPGRPGGHGHIGLVGALQKRLGCASAIA